MTKKTLTTKFTLMLIAVLMFVFAGVFCTSVFSDGVNGGENRLNVVEALSHSTDNKSTTVYYDDLSISGTTATIDLTDAQLSQYWNYISTQKSADEQYVQKSSGSNVGWTCSKFRGTDSGTCEAITTIKIVGFKATSYTISWSVAYSFNKPKDGDKKAYMYMAVRDNYNGGSYNFTGISDTDKSSSSDTSWYDYNPSYGYDYWTDKKDGNLVNLPTSRSQTRSQNIASGDSIGIKFSVRGNNDRNSTGGKKNFTNVNAEVTAISISFSGVEPDYLSGGDGSEGNPFILSSQQDFLELSDLVTNNFRTDGRYFKVNPDANLYGQDASTIFMGKHMVAAVSTVSGYNGEGFMNLFDSNPNTKYCGEGEFTLILDYGTPIYAEQVIWTTGNDNKNGWRNFVNCTISGSNDGVAWSTLSTKNSNIYPSTPLTPVTVPLDAPGNYRYFKIVAKAQYSFSNNRDTVFEMSELVLVGDARFPGIGDASHPFRGNFDGKNCTIKNLTRVGNDYCGLFNYVSGANIHDLTLDDTSSVFGASRVGGIIGRAENGTSLKNLTNNASVSGSGQYVGGVVGNVNFDPNAGMGACSLSGTIKNTGAISGVSYVGGICGMYFNSTANAVNCINTGAVSATGSSVGGIFGFANSSIGSNGTFTNSGSVTAANSVGGIVGRSQSSLSKCSNSGKIVATSSAYLGDNEVFGNPAGVFVGGITGYTIGNVTISHSYNSGEICGTNVSGGAITNGNYVGGITGFAQGNISYCVNEGIVKGSDYLGGIVGYSCKRGEDSSANISYCYNLANTTTLSSGSHIGGVAAVGSSVTVLSWNIGSLNSSSVDKRIEGYDTVKPLVYSGSNLTEAIWSEVVSKDINGLELTKASEKNKYIKITNDASNGSEYVVPTSLSSVNSNGIYTATARYNFSDSSRAVSVYFVNNDIATTNSKVYDGTPLVAFNNQQLIIGYSSNISTSPTNVSDSGSCTVKIYASSGSSDICVGEKAITVTITPAKLTVSIENLSGGVFASADESTTLSTAAVRNYTYNGSVQGVRYIVISGFVNGETYETASSISLTTQNITCRWDSTNSRYEVSNPTIDAMVQGFQDARDNDYYYSVQISASGNYTVGTGVTLSASWDIHPVPIKLTFEKKTVVYDRATHVNEPKSVATDFLIGTDTAISGLSASYNSQVVTVSGLNATEKISLVLNSGSQVNTYGDPVTGQIVAGNGRNIDNYRFVISGDSSLVINKKVITLGVVEWTDGTNRGVIDRTDPKKAFIYNNAQQGLSSSSPEITGYIDTRDYNVSGAYTSKDTCIVADCSCYSYTIELTDANNFSLSYSLSDGSVVSGLISVIYKYVIAQKDISNGSSGITFGYLGDVSNNGLPNPNVGGLGGYRLNASYDADTGSDQVKYVDTPAIIYYDTSDKTKYLTNNFAIFNGNNRLSNSTDISVSELPKLLGDEGILKPDGQANPSVTIRGTGNYTGEYKVWFTLMKSDFDVLDGYTRDENWGTQANPYVISAPEHMLRLYSIVNATSRAWDSVKGVNGIQNATAKRIVSGDGDIEYSDYLGCYFVVTEDITLSKAMGFVPIGKNEQTSFNATEFKASDLNGNGETKTITIEYKDSSDYIGIFGYANGTRFERITVTGSVEGHDYTGGLIGYGKNISLINCTNQASVSGSSCVGGLVGRGDAIKELSGCVNGNLSTTSSITGLGHSVGGILGYGNYTVGTGTIATNYMSVSGKTKVGGCFGNLTWTSHTGKLINYGNISASSDYVGGIVGVYTINNSGYLIDDSTNEGVVTGKNYTAGIIGSTEVYYEKYDLFLTIVKANNVAPVNGVNYVGGIIGNTATAIAYTNTVTNSGKITGTGSYLGGIAGNSTNSNINGVTLRNTAVIYGSSTSDYVGGLFGYLTLNHSATSGNFETYGTYVGRNYVAGIAGYINTNKKSVAAKFISGLDTAYTYNSENVILACGGFFGSHIFGYCEGNSTVEFSKGSIIEGSTEANLNGIFSGGVIGGIAGANIDLALDLSGADNFFGAEFAIVTITANNSIGDMLPLDRTSNVNGIGGVCGYNNGKIYLPESEISYTARLRSRSSVENYGNYAGGIVAYNDTDGVIENVYFKFNKIGWDADDDNRAKYNGRYVGGIVGYNKGNVNNIISVSGDVYGFGYVGGFFGYNSGIVTFTPKNTFTHSGKVTGWNDVGFVGGFAGYSSGCITLKNFTQSGAVTSSGSYVGGIFGNAKDAVLQNVSYTNSSIKGNSYVGGIAGYLILQTSGTDISTVNIASESALQIDGSGAYVGGYFGYFKADNSGIVKDFEPCTTNQVTVIGKSYTGGIAGYFCGSGFTKQKTTKEADSNDTIVYINKEKYKTKISLYGDGIVVGGLFGEVEKAGVIVLQDIYTGTLFSDTNPKLDIKNTSFFGGIIGIIGINATIESSISESTETRHKLTNNLIIDKGGSYVGGVVGYIAPGAGVRTTTGTELFEKICLVNNANITGHSYVGGIIGYVGDIDLDDVEFKQTSNDVMIIRPVSMLNSGNISLSEQSDGYEYVGGLIGYVGKHTQIELKNIESQNYYFAEELNIYNKGEVSGGKYVGGIAGYLSQSNHNLTFVLNNNNVSGKSFVGGLVGFADKVHIEGCVVYSNIKGDENVGGFVGQMNNGEIVYSFSYSFDDYSKTSSSSGGVVGDAGSGVDLSTAWTFYLGSELDYNSNCKNNNGKYVLIDETVGDKPSISALAKMSGMYTGNVDNWSSAVEISIFGNAFFKINYENLTENPGKQLVFYDVSGTDTVYTGVDSKSTKYISESGNNDIKYPEDANPEDTIFLLCKNSELFIGIDSSQKSIIVAVKRIEIYDIPKDPKSSEDNYQGNSYSELGSFEESYLAPSGYSHYNNKGDGYGVNAYLVVYDADGMVKAYMGSVALFIGKERYDIGYFNYTDVTKGNDAVPYLISSVEDWISLSNRLVTDKDNELNGYSGCTIKLTCNIETIQIYSDESVIQLDEKSIDGIYTLFGSSSRPFKGTFDGNGYSIKIDWPEFSADGQGLFPFAHGATIKHLTVMSDTAISTAKKTGEEYDDGYKNLAVFVGSPTGNVSIEDCISAVDINDPKTYNKATGKESDPSGTTGNASYNVGAFVGYVEEGSVTLKNCVNLGNITTKAFRPTTWTTKTNFFGVKEYTYNFNNMNFGTGGIIGKIESGAEITLDSCRNSGKIVAGQNVGGVCGISYKTLEIKNCANTGEISAESYVGITSPDASDISHLFCMSCAGGILGKLSGTNGELTLLNSYNSGNITAYGNIAGGLVGGTGDLSVGQGGSTDSINTGDTKILYCYNTGNIKTGGTAPLDIYDKGSLNVATTISGTICGGIIGLLGTGYIGYCYNTGNITSNGGCNYGWASIGSENQYRMGGIVGEVLPSQDKSSSVNYCYNIGEISGDSSDNGHFYYGAGIIGYVDKPILDIWESIVRRVNSDNCFSLESCVYTTTRGWGVTKGWKDSGNYNGYEGLRRPGTPVKLEDITAFYDKTSHALSLGENVGEVFKNTGAKSLINNYAPDKIEDVAPGYIYVYGCLPQLAVFALDTKENMSMLSVSYGKNSYGRYSGNNQAGSKESPYVIVDGIDMLCFSALTNAETVYDFKDKYIETANGHNNLNGIVSNEIDFKTYKNKTYKNDSENDEEKVGKSYHLYEKGALCNKSYHYTYDVGGNSKNKWLSSNYNEYDEEDNVNYYPVGMYGEESRFSGSFSGKLDGTSTTIFKNITIKLNSSDNPRYAGLFGYVQNADISYIKINESYIKATSAKELCFGTVVGFAGGASCIWECNVENGDLTYEISATGDNAHTYVGGIVGKASTLYYVDDALLSADELIIRNCSSSINILTPINNAGGILGAAVGDEKTNGKVIISNCKVKSCEISADNKNSDSNSKGTCIGGIAGSSDEFIGLTIEGCEVGEDDSDLAPCSVTISGENRVGGLVGYTCKRDAIGTPGTTNKVHGDVLIKRCYWETADNYTIDDSNSVTAIGGIVGCTGDGDSTTSFSGNIEFSGEIQVDVGENVSAVGGMVGYLGDGANFSNGSNFTINGNLSIGNEIETQSGFGGVAGIANTAQFDGEFKVGIKMSVKNAEKVGGFIGSAKETIDIVSKYTTDTLVTINAAINAKTYVGGFIGYIDSKAMVTISSSSSGEVKITIGKYKISATGDNVGGIVGYNEGKFNVLTGNITSNGIVEGHDNVGGIIGNNAGALTFENPTITNAGKIEGQDRVGGVIGNISKGTISGEFTNNGEVTGNEFVGGSIGFAGEDVIIQDKNSSSTLFVNKGDVTGGAYVGGSIGVMLGSIKGKAPVKDDKGNITQQHDVVFENHGKVSNGDSEIGYIGGSVGVLYGPTSYASFINKGNIISSAYAAIGGSIGIIGLPEPLELDSFTNKVISISNSHFEVGSKDGKAVTLSVDPQDEGSYKNDAIGGVGGIIGIIDNVKFGLTTEEENPDKSNTFFVLGDVSAPYLSNVGGSIGLIRKSDYIITVDGLLSYNSKVAGYNNVGGIIGGIETGGEKVIVSNSFNVSTNIEVNDAISAKCTSNVKYGGIVGGKVERTNASTSYWIVGLPNLDLAKMGGIENIQKVGHSKPSVLKETYSGKEYELTGDLGKFLEDTGQTAFFGEDEEYSWDNYLRKNYQTQYESNEYYYVDGVGCYELKSVGEEFFNTGDSQTGYYFIYANDKGIEVKHSDNGTNDESDESYKYDLNAWKKISGSYPYEETISGSNDNISSWIVPNLGTGTAISRKGNIDIGHIYATAQPIESENEYLYIMSDNENISVEEASAISVSIGSADNCKGTFFISAELMLKPENIVVYYRPIGMGRDLIYNGKEQYAPISQKDIQLLVETAEINKIGYYYELKEPTGPPTEGYINAIKAKDAGNYEAEVIVWYYTDNDHHYKVGNITRGQWTILPRTLYLSSTEKGKSISPKTYQYTGKQYGSKSDGEGVVYITNWNDGADMISVCNSFEFYGEPDQGKINILPQPTNKPPYIVLTGKNVGSYFIKSRKTISSDGNYKLDISEKGVKIFEILENSLEIKSWEITDKSFDGTYAGKGYTLVLELGVKEKGEALTDEGWESVLEAYGFTINPDDEKNKCSISSPVISNDKKTLTVEFSINKNVGTYTAQIEEKKNDGNCAIDDAADLPDEVKSNDEGNIWTKEVQINKKELTIKVDWTAGYSDSNNEGTYSTVHQGVSEIKLSGFVPNENIKNTGDYGNGIGVELIKSNNVPQPATITDYGYSIFGCENAATYNVNLGMIKDVTKSNYTIKSDKKTWTIKKKEVDVSKITVSYDKTDNKYNGKKKGVSATLNDGLFTKDGDSYSFGANKDIIEIRIIIKKGNVNTSLCNAGTYSISLDKDKPFTATRGSDDKSGNYMLSGSFSESFEISKAVLTVEFENPGEYYYNGNSQGPKIALCKIDGTNATIEEATITSAKIKGYPEDVIKFTISEENSDFVNAGEHTLTVSSYAVSGTNEAGSSNKENYAFNSVSRDYTIRKSVLSSDPKYISVSDNKKITKQYDGTISWSGTLSTDIKLTIPAKESGKGIELDSSGIQVESFEYDDKNVGVDKDVIVTISIKDAFRKNYTFEENNEVYVLTGITLPGKGEITKRPIRIKLYSKSNNQLTKVYDGTSVFATYTSVDNDGKYINQSDIYKKGQGFSVDGVVNINNIGVDKLSIEANFIESGVNRTKFDAYVNNVEEKDGTYVIGKDYYKCIQFELKSIDTEDDKTDDYKNYYLQVSSEDCPAECVSTTENGLKIYDKKEKEQKEGFTISITTRSIQATYKNTSQSYANDDNSFNQKWLAITGESSQIVKIDDVTIMVYNGWMYADGKDMNPGNDIEVVDSSVAKYTDYYYKAGKKGDSNPEFYATIVDKNGKGKELNYLLRNQPTLTIGYFVDLDKDGVYNISSFAALMLATHYYAMNFTSAEDNYVIEWVKVCTGAEYENGTGEKGGYETWDAYFTSLETEHKDKVGFSGIVYEDGTIAEDEWGYWIGRVENTTYFKFIQTKNITAILTENDINLLNLTFNKEWGYGSSSGKLLNFVPCRAGEICVAIDAVFPVIDVAGNKYGFTGEYNGNGYMIDNLTIVSSSPAHCTTGSNADGGVGMFALVNGEGYVSSVNLRNAVITVYDSKTAGESDMVAVGGIIGVSQMNKSLINSSFHGSIVASAIENTKFAVGGLVGLCIASNDIPEVLNGAIVTGSIHVYSNADCYAGAIIGYLSGQGTTNQDITISNVVSLAELIIVSSNGNIYAGGIVGFTATNLNIRISGEAAYLDNSVLSVKGEVYNVINLTIGNREISNSVTYDELRGNSDSGYDDGGYTAAGSRAKYDVLFRDGLVAEKNEFISTRLVDIIDIYILLYPIVNIDGKLEKQSESPLVGRNVGTSSNRFEIRNQQHVALIREVPFASFVLKNDVSMYSTHNAAQFNGYFHGDIVCDEDKDYKINLRKNSVSNMFKWNIQDISIPTKTDNDLSA